MTSEEAYPFELFQSEEPGEENYSGRYGQVQIDYTEKFVWQDVVKELRDFLTVLNSVSWAREW